MHDSQSSVAGVVDRALGIVVGAFCALLAAFLLFIAVKTVQWPLPYWIPLSPLWWFFAISGLLLAHVAQRLIRGLGLGTTFLYGISVAFLVYGAVIIVFGLALATGLTDDPPGSRSRPDREQSWPMLFGGGALFLVLSYGSFKLAQQRRAHSAGSDSSDDDRRREERNNDQSRAL